MSHNKRRKDSYIAGKESYNSKKGENDSKSTTDAKIGEVYIPPAKRRMMQEKITDKASVEYQKLAWTALKKSLVGLTNKVNQSNIREVVRELFRENIVRGKGVLARAIIQAQSVSPTFTQVYAALVAIINSKFPQIGELILKRLIIQFKDDFGRHDKAACVSSTCFIAHLMNQQVAHDVVVLEILTLLLETPTEHSIEIAVAMLKEGGERLSALSAKGMHAIFDRLRHVLNEGEISPQTRHIIEVIFAVRKIQFKDYKAVIPELDLLEEDEKYAHIITLEEPGDTEDILNVFKFDPEYEVNEGHYKEIAQDLLGENESGESGSSDDDEGSSDEDEKGEITQENQKLVDVTETNLVALRRNIYLINQSSVDYEECAHKLLKLELNPSQIVEICYMILDCCAQQRTFEKYYGLLAMRLCQQNKVYVDAFIDIFRNSYDTIHRLETNKLRNIAKFFSYLLFSDAITWTVLSNIKLNENDTTSSSRIFIKILFQEVSDHMGLEKLNERIHDVTLQDAFDGLFPRDNPQNTRFAINFFTSIGLGSLTDDLREHLKNASKAKPFQDDIISTTANLPTHDVSSSSESEDDEIPSKHKKKSHGKKAMSKRKRSKAKHKHRHSKHHKRRAVQETSHKSSKRVKQ